MGQVRNAMKRDQLVFLSAGVGLGFALGFALAWGTSRAPGASAAGRLAAPPMEELAAPPSGERDLMSEVFQRLENLKTRIERDPTDAASLLELANIYMQIQRYEEARPYLEAAVEADPTSNHALTHLGIVLAETGDLNGARDRFLRTVEADPDYWEGWMYLAVTEVRRGDLSAARDATAHLEALNPDLPELAEIRQHLAEGVGAGP